MSESSNQNTIREAPTGSRKNTPGLAVASLVLGILSILGAAILIVPVVLSIVFGHISLNRINRDPNLVGKGIATAGLVLGYVSILFGIVSAGLLAAMAIPAFQKVRDNALTKAMQNDARVIAGASQQCLLSDTNFPLVFTVNTQTGEIDGPIKRYVPHISKGFEVVDGTITDAADSFSLRNPHVNGGKPVPFDIAGQPMIKLQ